MAGALYAGLFVLEPYMARKHGFLVQSGALGLLVVIGLLTFGLMILITGALSPAQLQRFRRRAGQ